MPRPATDKRNRLTDAATKLAYSRGFASTTIGDIAAQAGISLGSVYYYFKTKDDVGRAIADSLLSRYEELLAQWEEADGPRERLGLYISMYVGDADTIMAHGCPVGSLCTELRKVNPKLGAEAAAVFKMTIEWAAQQFAALGLEAEQANADALHLVIAIQGAAVLSNALGSKEPLEREATRLTAWISTVGTKGQV